MSAETVDRFYVSLDTSPASRIMAGDR